MSYYPPFTPRSFKCLLLSGFPTDLCMHLTPPHTYHTPQPPHPPTFHYHSHFKLSIRCFFKENPQACFNTEPAECRPATKAHYAGISSETREAGTSAVVGCLTI